MDDFSAPPFRLDSEAAAWVRRTYEGLTPTQRIRHLFVLRSSGYDEEDARRIAAFQPGGITRAMGADLAAEQRLLAAIGAALPTPLVVSADLEGSRMSLSFGTEVPNPLALAAVDDVDATRAISRIMAEEARAAGIHWSFTPVLDINAAFRSAIVATRGYGSDVERIARHAIAQIEEFQRAGVAATGKHWPGEGYDDRDQHLVTTINPLTIEHWDATFGRLYRAAIGAGVMSIMSAHIAFPAFVRTLDPGAGLEAFRPASISSVLNQRLLRERLGFRGLIVSDATSMGGLWSWAGRREHLPEIIANGCDVILFSDNPEGDAALIEEALADGRLSEARIEEAVLRLLALKAALGLHRPQRTDPRKALASPEKRALADGVTRRAPTLVKDTQKLLPLDPVRHRRVHVVARGIIDPWLREPIPFVVPDLLRQRGFEVLLHVAGAPMAQEADAVLYLFGEETLMTRGRIFLDWLALGGNPLAAMVRPWHDVPTAIISLGYPYYLYDAPRVPTYINAYETTETMQRAVVAALLGDIAWNTISPVDPFVGLDDARY